MSRATVPLRLIVGYGFIADGYAKVMNGPDLRPARTDEQKMLESLQRRASLGNPGDRDAV